MPQQQKSSVQEETIILQVSKLMSWFLDEKNILIKSVFKWKFSYSNKFNDFSYISRSTWYRSRNQTFLKSQYIAFLCTRPANVVVFCQLLDTLQTLLLACPYPQTNLKTTGSKEAWPWSVSLMIRDRVLPSP